MAADFRIVSLCGSAGALSAYVEILRGVPADSGMAYVVLTHRRIEKPCWLVQILSSETRMHVEEIADGMILRPNCVYIGPAGMDLTTDGEAFWLAPTSKVKGWPNTFDLFLNSVAQNTLGRAVTVILSGLAKDGSDALGGLKTSGGTNYAQANASETSMPRSAIATGKVDFIGSPGEIIAAIGKLPPLLQALAVLAEAEAIQRSTSRDRYASQRPFLDDLSVRQAVIHSSRLQVDKAQASIQVSAAFIRLSMEAIRHSQFLLVKSDRVICQLRGET